MCDGEVGRFCEEIREVGVLGERTKVGKTSITGI